MIINSLRFTFMICLSYILLNSNLIKINGGNINEDIERNKVTLYTIKDIKVFDNEYEEYKDFTSIHSEFVEENFDQNITNNYKKSTVNMNLTLFDSRILNVDIMNKHIRRNSPEDSPFIDQGKMFIEIGNELGVNPYYIYAHAALESGHGKSNLAITKGNYFGIGAFNSNPSAAYRMTKSNSSNKLYDGIYNGTLWIKNNYLNKGQDTLNKMLTGNKKYAVLDDGSPNYKWMHNIASLMK